MQTFLPYPDFTDSAKVLDYRRLGKQRVEAMQILNVLTGLSKGWSSHPAVKMWKGYEDALAFYMNVCIQEWIYRGYNNTMKIYSLPSSFSLPPWIGNSAFHASHRANLIRKDFSFYSKYNWNEDPTLPYLWPV